MNLSQCFVSLLARDYLEFFWIVFIHWSKQSLVKHKMKTAIGQQQLNKTEKTTRSVWLVTQHRRQTNHFHVFMCVRLLTVIEILYTEKYLSAICDFSAILTDQEIC